MSVTLSSLLLQSKDLYNELNEELGILNDCLIDTNDSVKEADKLIQRVLEDDTISDMKKKENRLEVLTYKSTILTIKADLENQKAEIIKNLKDTKKVIDTCEKAIQLNVGEVF